MEEKFYYKAPIGNLEIRIENDAVTMIKMVDTTDKNTIKSEFSKKVETQLDEYFSQKRKSFDFKINPKGTDFQKAVWKELTKIPYGKTKSYQEIAQLVGSLNAQRAVGMACNKNPILLVIPCHRVIAKSGALTGFACGIKTKEYLLDLENFYSKI